MRDWLVLALIGWALVLLVLWLRPELLAIAGSR